MKCDTIYLSFNKYHNLNSKILEATNMWEDGLCSTRMPKYAFSPSVAVSYILNL